MDQFEAYCAVFIPPGYTHTVIVPDHKIQTRFYQLLKEATQDRRVLVVINGDVKSFALVKEAIQSGTPVFLIKNTGGGAADVLATAFEVKGL
jgi:hypothetical protein